MNSCPFCGTPLSRGPPWAPGPGHRLAFDSEQGRLWEVCPGCSRWVLTPLDSRWETLETCEAAARDRGRVRLSSPNLALVDVGEGELIRILRPPRPEFVDWRYGPRLPQGGGGHGFWARLISRLPPPPVGGYDPYRGLEGAMTAAPWLASPFLESASPLTYLFSQVPFAPHCPSCRGPVALNPWEFQEIRFVPENPDPALLAGCGLCREQVVLPLEATRPALRLGLSLVTPSTTLRELADSAAHELEVSGGPAGLFQGLAASHAKLGGLGDSIRSALLISLDELAELAALEAEWREAEELAAIMDGELTQVPGFEAFRARILRAAEDEA